jgi:hypothetical protein
MRRELSGKSGKKKKARASVLSLPMKISRQLTKSLPEQAMNPIRIEPQRALDDAVRFNQKLAAGLKTLRTLDDVTYGATDKEDVYREDKLVLYRFKGEQAPTAKTPLLIVYALVNRPYMVDLQDDRSLVKNLLALGEDVYLIDWGYPDRPTATSRSTTTSTATSAAASMSCAKRHKWTRSTCSGSARAGVQPVLRLDLPAEDPQPDRDGHAGRFPHAGQHAVALDTGHGRRPVHRHARQRAGRPDELVLSHAQAGAPVPAEIHRHGRHPRRQGRAREFPAHGKVDF